MAPSLLNLSFTDPSHSLILLGFQSAATYQICQFNGMTTLSSKEMVIILIK